MMHDDEFFGSPDKQKTIRKAADLWKIVKSDRRMVSHGRAVALNYEECPNIELHMALTRLLGVSAAEGVPTDTAEAYIDQLTASGFKHDRYESWQVDDAELTLARAVVADNALADDLEVVSVDAGTPAETMMALSELTDSCDVLLPQGKFMRGIDAKSVCLFARDRAGKIVGCAASVATFHPDSNNAETVWWGMLATHIDRRGERIALILGAMAMIAMFERHGFSSFVTGIRQGNVASEKLCAKLGLTQRAIASIIAIDATAFAGGQLTK